MALGIFTKDGAANSPLELPKGRLFPINEPIQPNQYRGIAGGGQVMVADLGTAVQFFLLVMNNIPKAKRDDILEFIQHANVNYAQFTFTFTNEGTTEYTVRWWDEEIDLPQVRGDDLFNLRMLLRVEIT